MGSSERRHGYPHELTWTESVTGIAECNDHADWRCKSVIMTARGRRGGGLCHRPLLVFSGNEPMSEAGCLWLSNCSGGQRWAGCAATCSVATGTWRPLLKIAWKRAGRLHRDWMVRITVSAHSHTLTRRLTGRHQCRRRSRGLTERFSKRKRGTSVISFQSRRDLTKCHRQRWIIRRPTLVLSLLSKSRSTGLEKINSTQTETGWSPASTCGRAFRRLACRYDIEMIPVRFSVALRPQTDHCDGLFRSRDGSPGWPPRLSDRAPKLWNVKTVLVHLPVPVVPPPHVAVPPVCP